jgi:hypothetical protein
MALNDKREEAEILYVRQGLSCPAIAEQIGVDQGTVYRWKTEAAKKGEAMDWDVQRRTYSMSPRELLAIYAESVKAWIVMLKAHPELLANPQIADALSKHVSVMQKLNPRGQYLGVAIDLIKVINTWLAEKAPKLKEAIEPHWDEIYLALKEYTTTKGIF